MASNPLQRLSTLGQSVWNDNLSRDLLRSGGLQRLIDEAAVVGVTSNPTIFDKAISGSDDYDDQIKALAGAGRNTTELFDALVIDDIRHAADVLRPIWEATRETTGDGYVSLEVAPGLAHDTEGTIADVRRLFAQVGRPNVMIKIPGTAEGIPAIEQMLYEGYHINITLLFALDAYLHVAEAYLKALERRLAEGKSVADVASVASFFVSRVDTEADKRLQAIIDSEPGTERAATAQTLLGKLAVANAKLAYQRFQQVFESERFQRLADQGAKVQRPLWASTSTKNPAYSDTLYVDELIGPETVQTLAPASIEAFGDHGHVAPTLEAGLDEARAVFQGFEDLGISYDDITATLVREGVASFSKSFESLLGGLDDKRRHFVDEVRADRARQTGPLAPTVASTIEDLRRDDVPARLQSRDPSLWSGEQAEQQSISQRMGWLPVVDRMLGLARDGIFAAFSEDVRERGYEHAVLFGMGGSSLAPEVFSKLYAPAEGSPSLIVVDTTNPDSIVQVRDNIRGKKTLFIVSTKSGTTVETMSLFHFFLAERNGDASDFVAVTDPGTALETQARDLEFWRIFLNPPDIGGRYSALSFFGLVAAAATGIDVRALLERAATTLPIHDEDHPGIWLGAVLGAAHWAGRDKLTFLATSQWQPLGDWLEQLIAESTGKQGVGIIPVTGEHIEPRGTYAPDRLFVRFQDDSPGSDALDEAVSALRAAGHPVIEIPVDGPAALGQEFVRWEVATAVAGGLLGINPFDEANVQEAKDATKAVLTGDTAGSPPSTPVDDAIQRLLAKTQERGYIAIMAYVDRSPAIEQALQELRSALSNRTHLATTLGFGPRFLHSTGQLHKGGPPIGAFLQVVATPASDLAIPGAEFDFKRLFEAQSLGDAITLSKHNLPLVRVEVVPDAVPAIQALTAAARKLPAPV